MEVAFDAKDHFLMENKVKFHHFNSNRKDWPSNIPRPVPNVVPGRVAFLGDSHMRNLFRKWKSLFPSEANITFFGQGGERLGVRGQEDNMFLRKYLPLLVAYRPSRIIVWVGGNDMGRNNGEDTHKLIFLKFMTLIDTLRWNFGNDAVVAMYQPNRDMDRSCLNKEDFKKKCISFNRHFRRMERDHYYMLPWQCYQFNPAVPVDDKVFSPDGVHLKDTMYMQIARELHDKLYPTTS